MKEENEFKECLSKVVRKARMNHNCITEEEIAEAFSGTLSPEQLLLVEEYLKNTGIKTGAYDEENANEEMMLEGRDVSFLQMYLDELELLPRRTEEEMTVYKKAALEGEEYAKKELVNAYLPKVVEIAKLYTGQGLTLEDLIGEGNIGLMMGIELLSCLEREEEIEGHLGKMVMDAMDSAIAEGNEEMEFDRQMIEKIEEIAAKAKELSEDLRHDVTVEELAAEAEIEAEEIRQALKLTGNRIEGIAVEENL